MKEREIKVGDYIRCGIAGIMEVVEVNKSPTDFKVKSIINEKGLLVKLKYIKNFSDNITDLIEEGDYVNGREVGYWYDYDEDGNDIDGLGILYNEEDNQYLPLTTVEIKTILTKEQYNAKCYEIQKEGK